MPTQANDNLFNTLTFDNRFVRELPGDPEADNYRRQVYQSCYSRVSPKAVKAPRLVAYSREMAGELDLSEAACQSEVFCQVFAGNHLLDGMEPYAMNYGGQQFGHWAGQLGDGRAINLGEVVNRQGRRWTLQLKGAGPTPYSRSADGLAVLRSSIREFLCSEAMHHLGVPTTRALSVILTGEQVVRDMFYDGNPQLEPGAVVCRVAPSFIRFGNFQLFTSRDDLETLKQLVDFTIKTDFPHLGQPGKAVYLQWFAEICRGTAEMIAHWQRVGFVHGVMNTDNMSILGLTIDYGPYGWLENYDPDWTPNTTDAQGRRYRFGNQPKIAYWNLVQLANALYPLILKAEPLQDALTVFTQTFEQTWQRMQADKLGLTAFDPAVDQSLTAELAGLLQAAETDMTLFYRGLSAIEADSALADFRAHLEACAYAPLSAETLSLADAWFKIYQGRLQRDGRPRIERQQSMDAVNPLYVLRNYLAQQAIDLAEQGDFSEVWQLLEVLRRPYTEQAGKQRFAEKRPDWAKQRAGCSMLSCSS
ncbi:YdiU family protein [Methylomonas sp. SURF-2]|uniref:Protein nucleotidyltransferase YdiU n=1 Tax=Methylomonas subterranea TaxID=2952225 RepID=A0ABT1TD44_9GAMM|nr:YdiU family protein [Methylomonas sp. SURF-2]MCQ8103350.1 YdiU family protein [Methylomonas sp. SURF-2]